MTLELLELITSLTFYLALIGYIANLGFKSGYFGDVYWPNSSNKNKLVNCAMGIYTSLFVTSILVIIIMALYGEVNSFLTLVQNSTIEVKFVIFAAPVVILPAISYCIGKSSLFLEKHGISSCSVITINTSTDSESLNNVKRIYATDEDFLYYFDSENKWGSVRKSDIVSMRKK